MKIYNSKGYGKKVDEKMSEEKKTNNVYYATSASRITLSCIPMVIIAKNLKYAREIFEKNIEPKTWPKFKLKLKKVDTIHKNRLEIGIYNACKVPHQPGFRCDFK